MRLLIALIVAVMAAGGVLAEDGRTLTGRLILLDAATVPDDAVLLIELRNLSGDVVKVVSLPLEDGPGPQVFALRSAPTAALDLVAALRVGPEFRWLSETVAIHAGSAPVDLGDLPLRVFKPMGFATTLACEDVLVELGFIGDIARLRVGGRYYDLSPHHGARGSLWADGADPETRVRVRDDSVIIDIEGTRLPDCRSTQLRANQGAGGGEDQ